MNLLQLTLDTPAENLALDEALLEHAETASKPQETLRIWESSHNVVVVGRSTQASQEVAIDACRQDDVSVLRRCSGGASIVAGPGCLMYAVVLSYELRPQLRMIDEAHCLVMKIHRQALASLGIIADFRGHCDLTICEQKFSGNSLRCKRTHFLYHGTFLYDFDLENVSRYLKTPARQPDYRQQRSHDQFVVNLATTRTELENALINCWGAEKKDRPESSEPLTHSTWPRALTQQLADEKYRQDSWNLRR